MNCGYHIAGALRLGPKVENQEEAKYERGPSLLDTDQFGEPEAKDMKFEEMKVI